MGEITLGSLFDGIGVFPLAARRNGIVPVWASEIVKAPISITRRHFPDMEHLGDITKLDGGKIPPRPCAHLRLALSKSFSNWQQDRACRGKIKPVFSRNTDYQRNEGCY